MVYFPKSQPAPASLAAKKSWKGEDVMLRLQADFHNKCYICEDKGITYPEVEHFKPHRGDETLKYDWNNLFFACGHCNHTKGDKNEFNDILNCTNPVHRVTDWISYGYDITNFPKIKVIINEVVSQVGVEPTIKLLSDVYNGIDTPHKKIGSGNLRSHLHKELAVFTDLLAKFYRDGNMAEEEIQSTRDSIIAHLQKDSAFSAFKIWMIRSKESYMADFGKYIPA